MRIEPRRVVVPGMGAFASTSVPQFTLEAYRKMVGVSRLRCVPRLVALEHAGGAGGFYVDGVIAFGLADLEALADRMVEYFEPVPHDQLWWYERFQPHRLITAQDRLEAATTSLLAHELGHAWAAQWGVSKFGVPEEIQADRIAGQLAGTLCTRAEIDHAFFHAIGCTSPVGCTHPSPEDRVNAYVQGRATADRCVPTFPMI